MKYIVGGKDRSPCIPSEEVFACEFCKYFVHDGAGGKLVCSEFRWGRQGGCYGKFWEPSMPAIRARQNLIEWDFD